MICILIILIIDDVWFCYTVPEGLAIDIENRLLYWTDNGTDTIEKANLDGSNIVKLFDLGLRKPRAIVVDSNEG